MPFLDVQELKYFLDFSSGMQELMCDEDGNPLAPDHPQYKKFTGLMENIAERAQKKNQENTSIPGHQGTA